MEIEQPTAPATASGAEWGDIAGTLSAQTDLQSALDAKADGNQSVGTGSSPTFAGLTSNSAQVIEGRLASVTLDLNTTDPQTFFTCPAGKTCIPTVVILRDPSTNLSAADGLAIVTSVGETWAELGFVDSGFVSGRFKIVHAGQNAVGGMLTVAPGLLFATESLRGVMASPFGGAATCTIDIFGYLY